MAVIPQTISTTRAKTDSTTEITVAIAQKYLNYL